MSLVVAIAFGKAVATSVALGAMLGGLSWLSSTEGGKQIREMDLNPFKKR